MSPLQGLDVVCFTFSYNHIALSGLPAGLDVHVVASQPKDSVGSPTQINTNKLANAKNQGSASSRKPFRIL
jgi:hypothetical protein